MIAKNGKQLNGDGKAGSNLDHIGPLFVHIKLDNCQEMADNTSRIFSSDENMLYKSLFAKKSKYLIHVTNSFTMYLRLGGIIKKQKDFP